MVSERIQKHIQRLTESRAKLYKVLDHIGERGNEQIYSDGAQWTIHQLMIHLVIADQGHNAMAMGIAAGQEVIPADYDLERFNRRSVEKRGEMTLAQAREALIKNREALLAWLNTLDDVLLDQEGRHASMIMMSVNQILQTHAAHEDLHTRDIAAKLGIEL